MFMLLGIRTGLLGSGHSIWAASFKQSYIENNPSQFLKVQGDIYLYMILNRENKETPISTVRGRKVKKLELLITDI